MAEDRIIIFDTTLRDGEQSPGMSMTIDEKLLVAEALDQMGVDVIEAGFAMASEGDFAAVQAIAKQTQQAVVCSLARAKAADIERAAEAIKPAKRGRIHTFMSTSPIHLKYQFNKSEEEVLEMIRETVTLARNFTDDVEWSAMDSTRTGMDYLCQAVAVAIKAGATTINLPDTVGYATPQEVQQMFEHVRGRMLRDVKGADKVIFSFHGQNDLGLATANTLAAISGGARQAEVTIDGIGERAGNTALEEVVMILKTRKDSYGLTMNIDTTHIMRVSKLVQSVTGQAVQVNKAIVGANAFAHESGIHQDGMLKHAETYEIMTPESVGLTKSNLVMGKHSGRHAFRDKLKELGITLGENAFEDAFARMKALADKKKTVFDDDILSLVEHETDGKGRAQLSSLAVTSTHEGQKATLNLLVDGKAKTAVAESKNGPVDVCYQAIRQIIPHEASLKLYQVNAVTAGIDAQAEVLVRLEGENGVVMNGNGADTDTMVASTKAYLDALNKLLNYQEKLCLTTQD